MAVVSKKSNLIADYVAMTPIADPEFVRGRPVVATGSVTNAADDSAGSTYLLASLPAHAILSSATALAVANWGFATVQIGTLDDPDALISVLKSAGNTVSPVTFGDTAKHGKHLWEILGLAAEPKSGFIDLYATAAADATAAGTLLFELHYRTR